MKQPLIPVAALVALVILVCEGCFGLLSSLRDPSRNDAHYSRFVGDYNWMLVEVSAIPTHGTKSMKVPAEVVEIGDDSCSSFHHCRGKILLYLSPSDSLPSIGDQLLVYARPSVPSSVDNPHQFDYRKHLLRRGITHTAYVPSTNYRILSHSKAGIMAHINALRLKLIGIIQNSVLTPEQRGIAEAIFLGWDDDLSPETESSFRGAGITHLLCVSGLHVGIVAMLVGYCLFFLSNRRRHRIIKGCIQLAAICLFVMLTGMAPGTTRAGLMFSLIVIGQTFFHRPPILNTIAASAVVLLAINPLWLFEIGFQLSYCSVISIVVLVPRLQELTPLPYVKNRMARIPIWLLRRLRDLAAVSLSAQLAVSPFILYYFHQFPLYFLVANIVIVPFAGILLASIMVMTFFAWWPCLFKILGSIVAAELSATSSITTHIASWPKAIIEGVYFDQLMLFFTLAIVVAAVVALIRRSTAMLALALALAIPLIIHCRIVENRCSSQRDFTIYNIGNRTAIEFFAGHDSYLLCDNSIALSPQSIDYQSGNNLIWHKAKRTHILALDTTFNDGILFVDSRFVGFGDMTMRIIDRSNYRQRPLSADIAKLDYLLLRGSPYITVSELRDRYCFDTLIIASQNSPRYRQSWINQCDSMGVPYR